MGLLNAGQEVRTIKALLTGAEQEARSHGEELPGPEHLLVSALNLPDGSASRVLAGFGVDTPALRAAIEQVHAGALLDAGIELHARPAGATDDAELPFPRGSRTFRSTPQAQQVFQEAVSLSKTAKPSRLLGAHVAAAASSLERGTLVRALGLLGIDRSDLRRAALEEAAR